MESVGVGEQKVGTRSTEIVHMDFDTVGGRNFHNEALSIQDVWGMGRGSVPRTSVTLASEFSHANERTIGDDT